MARKRQRVHRGSENRALEEEEDHLLHMDPSLMTERQQMAFLLRTTAHEGMEIMSHSSDASVKNETGTSLRHLKKAKEMHERQNRASVTSIHRGRGRPPKTKKKRHVAEMKLQVTVQKENQEQTYENKVETDESSPSGLNDISRLNAATSYGQRTPQCALCFDYDMAHEASFTSVLFLCPACDRKYPTQQALGRRTCMI